VIQQKAPVIIRHSKPIFLADDDLDDCFLFEEALSELPVQAELYTAHDGVELMQMLVASEDNLPFILFLDLNMPRKNGFQCLQEIKSNRKFKEIDVIILSTSFDQDIANELLELGASHCLRKPNDIKELKRSIYDAIVLADESVLPRTLK